MIDLITKQFTNLYIFTQFNTIILPYLECSGDLSLSSTITSSTSIVTTYSTIYQQRRFRLGKSLLGNVHSSQKFSANFST